MSWLASTTTTYSSPVTVPHERSCCCNTWEPPMSDVATLSNSYVNGLAEADPCLAAFLGISGHDGELTDYSPDGFEARRDLTARTLAALKATPVVSDADRIGASVLRERLEVELALAEAGTHTELNSMD